MMGWLARLFDGKRRGQVKSWRILAKHDDKTVELGEHFIGTFEEAKVEAEDRFAAYVAGLFWQKKVSGVLYGQYGCEEVTQH